MDGNRWYGMNEGIYGASNCSQYIGVQNLPCASSTAWNTCETTYPPPKQKFSQEYANRNPSFYDPNFNEGVVSLEPVPAAQLQFNYCTKGPAGCMLSPSQPMSMVYPNDMNSELFRKISGYGVK